MARTKKHFLQSKDVSNLIAKAIELAFPHFYWVTEQIRKTKWWQEC